MTTEEKVLERLEQAIEKIESSESINIIGILGIISQEVLRINGKMPKYEARLPQICLEIDEYDGQQRRSIKYRQTPHNRTGALLSLKDIRDKYQKSF